MCPFSNRHSECAGEYSLPLQLTLGQRDSTIDIREIIDTGQTLVVDLSDIGQEPARLLGAVIISQFSLAAAGRRESDDPADYTLFIDEFQNFATKTAPRILAEARKRRLSLCIAHQYVSQLEPDVRDAILANCGTLVCFRVGANYAPIMADAMGAPAEDLKDLPRGLAWVRVMIDGQPHRALPMRVPQVQLRTRYLTTNIERTRANFARARKYLDKNSKIRKSTLHGSGFA